MGRTWKNPKELKQQKEFDKNIFRSLKRLEKKKKLYRIVNNG